jgi:succinate dehydrogenase / fumarate reductase cytochrome b subunit
VKPNRPKYLDLRKIHLPVSGWVSVLHRATGLLLFLALPLLLWALQTSLRSPETWGMLASIFAHPLSKIFLIVVLWAFLHHFCAGIRYLGLDFGYGIELAQARGSSKGVLLVSLALTVLLGAWLW